MTNSDSNLIKSTILSPYCTKHAVRAIDTITIHCMAGNLTVENCGRLFQQTGKNASSNYGIDSTGKIALYVHEKDASWCSSNTPNDERAITIEVANTAGKEKDYPISEEAYKSLVLLVTDVCQRNHIEKLLWKNDKNLVGLTDKQNITLHRWFKNKTCPGAYIESKLPKLVEEVNKKLVKYYRVQVGAYSQLKNAQATQKKLKELGFDAIIKEY